jgi:chemosensory pili system protein ChpA (sensor histidine kinase/response regulator)
MGLAILVVEDSEPFRQVLAELLELDGHTVWVCDSGASALKCLMETQVDLVITDLQMPKMDGFELMRKLRRSRPELGVIAISGLSDQLLQIATSLGAKAVLGKPFSAEELFLAVRTVAERRC